MLNNSSANYASWIQDNEKTEVHSTVKSLVLSSDHKKKNNFIDIDLYNIVTLSLLTNLFSFRL